MNLYTHIPAWMNKIIEKFICCMMQWWKKSTSRRIFNDCMKHLKEQWNSAPVDLFMKAIYNVMPNMEVKPKRVWWAVYQVPMPVPEKRQLFLAIRWILEASRKKKWIPMCKRLALEITDASNESWDAFKKREEVHKMAQANKAFAHFAKN